MVVCSENGEIDKSVDEAAGPSKRIEITNKPIATTKPSAKLQRVTRLKRGAAALDLVAEPPSDVAKYAKKQILKRQLEKVIDAPKSEDVETLNDLKEIDQQTCSSFEDHIKDLEEATSKLQSCLDDSKKDVDVWRKKAVGYPTEMARVRSQLQFLLTQLNDRIEQFGINDLPDSVLLMIFSYVPWQDQIKLESVSRRWNKVLSDKSLQKIGKIDLGLLVNGDMSKLPQAVRSLLVNKQKIFNSVTYDSYRHRVDRLRTTISTFSSNRPEHLISLKIDRYEGEYVYALGRFVNCFVNLEVLDLKCLIFYGKHREEGDPILNKIDISQLVKLKELKGENVLFTKCRPTNLVKMELNGLFMNYYDRDECDDFVQLLSTVASSIERLHLIDIDIHARSKKKSGLKFPKLIDFKVCDFRFDNITFNLVKSRSLKRFEFNSFQHNITNFNLSTHCLEYVNLVNSFADQFLASAKADPQRLCLLEYLKINNCSLTDLLDCFKPCYTDTYRLREFISGIQLTDSSGLIALVEYCPLLNRISFNTNNNDQVLIDLIIGTINLDIHVDGLHIEYEDKHYYNKNFHVNPDFLLRLYNALCLIDRVTMKCENKVFVKVNDCEGDLIGKLMDEFNIIILV